MFNYSQKVSNLKIVKRYCAEIIQSDSLTLQDKLALVSQTTYAKQVL